MYRTISAVGRLTTKQTFTHPTNSFLTCVNLGNTNSRTVFRSCNLITKAFCVEKGSRPRCLASLCYNLQMNSHIHTTSRACIMEDKETKSLTVWSNLKELRRSPVPALTLGLSGLVPFIAAPSYLLMTMTFIPELAFAQVTYGACILSFLGGVRWGFTIPEENPVAPDWINLGYSVMPSLIAWGGLLLPSPYSLFTVMSGLGFVAFFDMSMYGYPPWFKGLRFLLSFVAILSLWSTFMCSLLLKSGDKETPKDQQ